MGIHRVFAVAFFLLLAPVMGCGSDAKLGESCDMSGSLDECEAGTICTFLNGSNTCYRICTEQAECPAGWNCNGVPNSNIKSCQP